MVLSWGNLRIESEYQICNLLDIEIYESVNEHGYMIFSAVLEENSYNNITHRSRQGVTLLHDQGKCNILFAGNVIEENITIRNETMTLHAKVVASSSLLDYEFKYASYQRGKMSYYDAVSQTLEKAGAKVMNFSNNTLFVPPIFQYFETDWEFAHRMAAESREVIVPGNKQLDPQIGFGFPNRSPQKLIYKYYEDYSNRSGKIVNKIYSLNNYELGDIVFFNGTKYIGQKQIRMSSSISEINYIVGSKESFLEKPYKNRVLPRGSLFGRVIDVSETKLKVHFDIDDTQAKEEACWLNYMPASSNAMYAMPDLEETVVVTFVNDQEQKAFVSMCLKKDPANFEQYTLQQMETASNQMYSTNKNFMMFGDNNEVRSNKIQMDENHVSLFSKHQVRIKAKNFILLTANDHIAIQSSTYSNFEAKEHHTNIRLTSSTLEYLAENIYERTYNLGLNTTHKTNIGSNHSVNESLINALTGIMPKTILPKTSSDLASRLMGTIHIQRSTPKKFSNMEFLKPKHEFSEGLSPQQSAMMIKPKAAEI